MSRQTTDRQTTGRQTTDTQTTDRQTTDTTSQPISQRTPRRRQPSGEQVGSPRDLARRWLAAAEYGVHLPGGYEKSRLENVEHGVLHSQSPNPGDYMEEVFRDSLNIATHRSLNNEGDDDSLLEKQIPARVSSNDM